MSHLRRYLEDTAAIAPDRLEAALRRQQIYGGSLDTVLLELSICDPQTLCELLGHACGLEVVRVELLEDQDRPWHSIPASLQEIGWAVPLATSNGNTLVGIHPDLPNDRLGELYRAVPRVVPLVTPECGLEKVAAERTSSVVPQRYAVLFASFMAALRQRPSVSDVGFPIVPVDDASPDTAPVPEEPPDPHPAVEAPPAVVRPPSFGPPRESPDLAPPPSPATPPVRFTARGTSIASEDPLRESFDARDARTGVDAARSKLAEARTRDEAIDALVEGALVFSDRVAVFRVRGGTLKGLTAPHPDFARLRGLDVPLDDASSKLLLGRRWVGTTGDGPLAEAVGAANIPCTLHRIDVASRPVLALYVDHNGREFLPVEANLLDELCEASAAALESILRRLRSGTPESRASASAEHPPATPPASSDPAPSLQPPPLESLAPSLHVDPDLPGTPPAEPHSPAPAPDPEPKVVPPPDFGVTQPPGWSSPSAPPLPEGPSPAASMQRSTQVDGSPPTKPPRSSRPSAPRFVPPVLDETDDGGIIPLSSPIGHPTIRGRITIDDEDEDVGPPDHHDTEHAIEATLRAIVQEEGTLDDLRAHGEQGLRALAERLPGPLEVLRRDLRALPAPSAHGPLMRAAIRLGTESVPFILEQFDSPDPDVRFYAAFVFQELRDPRAMRPLSRLALDGTTDVRVIAMRVLETYSRYDGFEDATRLVRAELDSTHRTHQLYAGRAVGTLRDVAAIPKLITLLSSRDRFIQEAALESLCSITGQQHGLKPHRWKSWYQDHSTEHRVEWVIESLRHRDRPVRRWAHDELVRVTGHRVPFSPLGDRSSREVAYQAWVEWWTRHGRARLQARVPNRPPQ